MFGEPHSVMRISIVSIAALAVIGSDPCGQALDNPRPSATVHGAVVRQTAGAEGMEEQSFWSPYGFPVPEWTHLIDQTAVASARNCGPLTLALPCIGIDACGHALRQLGVAFFVKYAYDILFYLAGPLTALHGDIDHFHLGSIDGDLLSADIKSWDRVDGTIAGPPCPPWSSIGKRGSWEDERSRVWWKVTDILIDQGRKGSWFFILEIVIGMDTHQAGAGGDRSRHHADTPYGEWLAIFSKEAPMWEVHVWSMNTQAYLPQHRERLYTVGINRAVGCTSPRPPPMTYASDRLGLADLLHPGIPSIHEQQLRPRLRWHLFLAKAKFLMNIRAGLVPTVHGGHCMAVELDRSPDATWGVPIRYDGCTPTLRTMHRSTWVMLSACGGISRFLHPVEHLTLQGFPPEVSLSMTSEQIVHAAGNACSVPVMGAVLVQVLLACPQRDCHTGDGPSADRSRQPDQAAKRRCLQAEIVNLQCEARALAIETACLQRLACLRSRQSRRE